ncbi:MAG: hypothetical protein KAR56_00625 [Thermoplasmata archaeon]|nr:hypothetical protein [Thermoplasmata archaeon]
MNWKYILGAAVTIMPLIEDFLMWGGINMPTIADWIKIIIVIIGLILICLAYREDREKKAKENEKKEYRRLKKEILEKIPNTINVSIENMWNRDHKKITFLIKIENPTDFKLKPYKGNLSFYKGESATDERLINDKDLKPGRSGQTKEDVLPKGAGNIGFTLPLMNVGDLMYHTFRVIVCIQFKTKYGTSKTKKEDFTIKCGNRFLESCFKDKEPISIERFSDREEKWLNLPE